MLGGKIAAEGAPKDVVNRYVGYVLDCERRIQVSENSDSAQGVAANSTFRHGDGASRVMEIVLADGRGEATRAFRRGDVINVMVRAQFYTAIANPVVGILIRNRIGVDVFGTNTRIEQRELGAFQPGELLEVEFELDCLLSRGEYTLTVATQHYDGRSQDWLDEVIEFRVIDPKDVAGVMNLNTRVRHRKIGANAEQTELSKAL
jgi:lipopolysaccharide transport system ATP-binding protein